MPVLLRCVEPGKYQLAGERAPATLSAAEVAAGLRGRGVQTAPDLQLVLPAARCLVTTIAVAKHEVPHLAKALPWLLEDRLLEPAEQVHVVHGPVADGTAPVAAVNAAWLEQVLEDLRSAGLQPQSAWSELLLLPWQRGEWTVLLPAAEHAPVRVRHGRHAGFACARGNLHTALQLLLNEGDEAPRQVLVLVLSESGGEPERALFPVLLQAKLNVQRQNAAQQLHAAGTPECNLLQGRFAPALPWALWWRQWRIAAMLLAALLLSDLALSAYEAARLESLAEADAAAVVELYRSVQPEGAVVDPRLQLEQALAAVGASGQEGFLALLGRMAPALQASPGAQVQNLEYDARSGDLQLQILTSDLATAEALRAQLQQAGLDAELLGSSNADGGRRTRLRVGGGV